MRMPKPNDNKMEIMARLLRPWLEERNHRPEVFWKLPYHYAVMLYKQVCVGGQQLDHEERRKLFMALNSAEARVKGYSNPLDHITPEQLVEYFSSETSSEELNDLDKY